MTWWWESIHTANLYNHWSALNAFLEGTGVARPSMHPATFSETQTTIEPLGVADRKEALVWLLDRACDWPDGAMNANPPAVTNATVTLSGLEDGRWVIQWWNTLTGKQVSAKRAACEGGKLSLEAPAFQADIAARLRKEQ
jgi:hypothetical protein